MTGGVQAGLLSREITTPGCRRRTPWRKARPQAALHARSMRENRESPALPAALIRPAGRPRKAKAASSG